MLSTHKNHCVLVSYRPLAALARRARGKTRENDNIYAVPRESLIGTLSLIAAWIAGSVSPRHSQSVGMRGDVLACPQAKKAINPFDGRPMPCMFDPTCPAALPDAQFERGSIGEYKPRSGCSPLHGGCAWMRTGHSTQRARAAKHLGGK